MFLLEFFIFFVYKCITYILIVETLALTKKSSKCCITQWEKSPKKQSVFLTTLHCILCRINKNALLQTVFLAIGFHTKMCAIHYFTYEAQINIESTLSL